MAGPAHPMFAGLSSLRRDVSDSSEGALGRSCRRTPARGVMGPAMCGRRHALWSTNGHASMLSGRPHPRRPAWGVGREAVLRGLLSASAAVHPTGHRGDHRRSRLRGARSTLVHFDGNPVVRRIPAEPVDDRRRREPSNHTLRRQTGRAAGVPAHSDLRRRDSASHADGSRARHGITRRVRASADAIAGSVTLSTPGPQVLGISVKGASPVIAQGILQAVIAEFTAELTTTLQQRAQSLATLDQTQVTASAVTLANAQAALATYLRTHPAAGTLTDPEANLLESEVNAALQQHNSAEGTFTQNQQEAVGATDPNAFHVIDAPSMPVLPEPRVKRLIEAGVGGLLAGGLITVAALVLLVVMDTTIRTAEDVTTAFGLPTVAIAGVHDLDPLIKHRRRQARRGEALA